MPRRKTSVRLRAGVVASMAMGHSYLTGTPQRPSRSRTPMLIASLNRRSPVTLGAWVYLTAADPSGNAQVIIANDIWEFETTYHGVILCTSGSNQWEADYGDGGGSGSTHRRTFSTTATWSINTWYRVISVLQGATSIQIYVNGISLAGTNSGTGGALTYSTSAGTIGGTMGADFVTPTGLLDDIFIANRVWTQADVTLDYDLSRRGYPGVLNRVAPQQWYGSAAAAGGFQPYFASSGATVGSGVT